MVTVGHIEKDTRLSKVNLISPFWTLQKRFRRFRVKGRPGFRSRRLPGCWSHLDVDDVVASWGKCGLAAKLPRTIFLVLRIVTGIVSSLYYSSLSHCIRLYSQKKCSVP